MARGYFVSPLLMAVSVMLSVAAVATIIALSVVYSEEKAKNGDMNVPETTTAVVPTGISSTTGRVSATGTSSTTVSRPIPPSASTPQPTNPWNRYRLPKTLSPQHYDVELQPYLEKDPRGLYIFKGRSTVYFKCANPTNLVLVHSKKLNYTLQGRFHVSLSAVEGSSAPSIRRTWLEEQTQYLGVELSGNLERGRSYSLYSEFTGELAEDLAGFYRSEYTEGNQKRIIATTQMESCDARKAFPCFDEPDMKATFNITLVYKPPFVALSNMPNTSKFPLLEDIPTWSVTTFERTPKMSTYLLAFVVSDFEKVEQVDSGVQIQIWGRKAAILDGHGAYALNVTGRILRFLESYFNATYPLPKSDQVALPDFGAGAMENWGLITYRETALFYDPLISSIGNQERILTVIAHELAHQWFGNLVTLKWWNDLWLNEGFASYVHFLGADFAEPSWNIKDLMVQNEVYAVMGIDALASSHPLSSKEDEVNTPHDISQLFDSITYSKGASVIRMLAEFLTEPVFVQGLSSYLDTFKYGNTIYNDLWIHLQKAVDNQTSVQLPASIKDIMNTWVLQMGFPVVTVNTTTGAITQKHFLLDPESVVTWPSEFNYTWIVPVTWMKAGAVQPAYWLQGPSAANDTFKVTVGSADWILVNLNVVGYYRVNYDQENWRRLLLQLDTNHEAIPVINRAQIIDDAFNLARAKYFATTFALETTKFLTKETEYLPWQAALGSLSYFTLMFDRSDVYGPMKQYLQKQVRPLFQHFKNVTSDWTLLPERLMEQYNEVNAISAACTYGIQECSALASGLYAKWMSNAANNPITPNLRSAIYCQAIARGGEEEWNFAWERFQNATVATEADKLREAMACSREPWILTRYLEYTLDSTKIRTQDAATTINSIARNAVGQSLAWDFIRENWGQIYSQWSGSSFSISGLIDGVTQRFSSAFELKQLEAFKKDNELVGFGPATIELEQALEKTKANIKWVRENREPVRLWFEVEAARSP
ncbi:aminopeptidase Ey-like [Ambystoma mexicanum]|uniref:aminopeptidase Ey-like n=1 Tax=Ambystoma mexicanum TaxID=8296 RepID=UPI0037E9554E